MCVTIAVWFMLIATVFTTHSQLAPFRCQSEDCVELSNLWSGITKWTEYKVEDKLLKVWHEEAGFKLDCGNDDVFESHAFPVANPAIEVTDVWLMNCPLPTNRSIAEILSVFNVTKEYNTVDRKLFFNNLPAAPALSASHFTGLEDLNHLEILGAKNLPPTLAPKCLKPLRKLEILKVQHVFATELEVPPSLRDLQIYYSNFIQLPVAPALQALTVEGVQNFRLTPLPCKSLQKIKLKLLTLSSVPDFWLKNCLVLEDLQILSAKKLVNLPPMLLQDAGSLRRLSLAGTSLKKLPVGFLKNTPTLQKVELFDNQLSTLPRDLFAETRQIEKLNLKNNKLESSAIAALAPLVQLTELNLAQNENLEDFCEENGYSPLQNLTNLKKLDLRQTGITRICLDWKHNMTKLQNLMLYHTKVSNVTFKDMYLKRVVESTVFLPGIGAGALELTQDDYFKVARGDFENITLTIPEPLQCDCRLYWMRRTLSSSASVFQYIAWKKCSDGRYLRQVSPDSMTCMRPDECKAAGLPEQCQCETWAAEAPNHDPRLVRVSCENAGLNNMPSLKGLKSDRVYEILLAYNRISDLRAEDIRENIQELDLRYNFLKTVDEETAKKIQKMDGLLRLGGNQMDCSCHAAPLLRALHARNETLTDLSNATCSDGTLLLAAAIIYCMISLETVGSWLAGAFAVTLVFVVVGVKLFWSQQKRFFARAVLHRWGVRWCVDEPADEDREYDVFLTFSHKDSAEARTMLSRLEPQYRLCIHVRDWTPGELIAAQIMKSVRESRRTVALVSRHFLESKWARAEFREAHTASMLDAWPRLVVVLLEEPGALQMDEELRGYIATRTYLRWGESLFWHKLALALPRPRPLTHPPPVMELLPLPSDNHTSR